MSFIDEVRNVQQENFIGDAQRDAKIENAYQGLIKENVESIKKKIKDIAQSEAKEGIERSYITGRYDLTLLNFSLGYGSYKCGKCKYGTIYTDFDDERYFKIRFNDISTLGHGFSFLSFKNIGWVSITEFGKKFFEDLRIACSKENITLEYPRVYLDISQRALFKNTSFPTEGICIDEKYKTDETIYKGNLFTIFSFQL